MALKVNGVEISTQTDKFHWDKQFGLVDIAKAARRGRNLIELAGGFTYGVEIEEIYLVGDFALRQCGYQEYRLVQEPRLLTDGSWVYQGYPFYAGNMATPKVICGKRAAATSGSGSTSPRAHCSG